MAHDSVTRAQRLLRGCDLSWLETSDLARSFSRPLQAATGSPWVHISLRPPGSEDACETVCGERPSSEVGRWRAAKPLTVPISYQGAPLGSVSALTLDEPELRYEVCRELARHLGYHAQRLELDRSIRRRFGRDLHLAGTSPALNRLDRFLEAASRSTLPVLVVGDRGSGCESTAMALHLAGPARERPFVQVHCAALEPDRLVEQLAGPLRSGGGGTLLLARLEELDSRGQRLLCQALDDIDLGTAPDPPAPCRLIATAARRVTEPQAFGAFYRPLLDRLDILRCDLVPLRERCEDIAPLFLRSLRKLAFGQSVSLRDDAAAALQRYDWPGDAQELWQLAARVALTLEPGPVEPRHLEPHAPQIAAGRAAAPAPSVPAASGLRGAESQFPALLPPPAAPSPVPVHHPCIERAIAYIHHHYDRKLSLSEVAHHANASVSHLAHLLRQETGMTFTRIVAAVRIERAKRLLRDNPWESITAIANTAGFTELRHFERTFKGLVGLTPRGFRRIQSERQDDTEGFLPARTALLPSTLSGASR